MRGMELHKTPSAQSRNVASWNTGWRISSTYKILNGVLFQKRQDEMFPPPVNLSPRCSNCKAPFTQDAEHLAKKNVNGTSFCHTQNTNKIKGFTSKCFQ